MPSLSNQTFVWTKRKQPKETTLHVQDTFLYISLPFIVLHDLQRETSRNFVATRFVQEMLYVFLFTS